MPVCLIDLDFASGACADYLDLNPGWQLDELLAGPERLDAHMLDAMTTVHASGINVLAAQRKYGQGTAISEELIARTLDLAAHKFPRLVIDLPRYAESWTDTVVQGSTQFYVVTDFSIPGLKAAKRMAAEIADKAGGEIRPRIIVNKYERSLFGSTISRHEVNEVLRDAFAGYVGADRKLVGEAIDRGIPTTEIKAKNVLMTDLAKILNLDSQSEERKA
jgi:pilus assembly protein CpaE